jgi:uncharacterized membrane protein HdeD (DUF308 family)
METRVYKNWWILAANGVVAILFGILLLGFTEDAIKTIVKIFGGLLLLTGILLVILAIRNIKQDKGSLMIILEAVVTIGLGSIILIKPMESLDLFMTLIGIWAIIIGIVQLVVLMNIKEAVRSKNILLISAVATLALGIILVLIKGGIIGIVATLIGIASLALGLLMVYFSFLLRGVKFVPQKKEEPTEVK